MSFGIDPVNNGAISLSYASVATVSSESVGEELRSYIQGVYP